VNSPLKMVQVMLLFQPIWLLPHPVTTVRDLPPVGNWFFRFPSSEDSFANFGPISPKLLNDRRNDKPLLGSHVFTSKREYFYPESLLFLGLT